MLLSEVKINGGYWTFEVKGGARYWTPVFENPKSDSLFPFTLTTPRKADPNVFAIQAYNLLPNKSRNDLSSEQRGLLSGLEDALKLRSETDKIEPATFQALIEKCANVVVAKSGLQGQNPNRIVIITPGSSSDVADRFARTIQRILKVADEHVFLGHFTKRDADDFMLDVMDSPLISADDKERILGRAHFPPGAKIQSKAIQRGKRDVIRKADIHMHEVTKDFQLRFQKVPYLLVVDDNVQQGTTYKSIATLFTKNTGVQPGKSIGLAMFKYQ